MSVFEVYTKSSNRNFIIHYVQYYITTKQGSMVSDKEEQTDNFLTDEFVSKFYSGRSIFITGGTGYLGKVMIYE